KNGRRNSNDPWLSGRTNPVSYRDPVDWNVVTYLTIGWCQGHGRQEKNNYGCYCFCGIFLPRFCGTRFLAVKVRIRN
ncbi:MAG: hypothetical protein VX189_00825, partial [Planctomycetota bacterium]|nr:hypothetical protein [Planctomycetota bacterium]